MSKHSNVIELNGIKYDAVTGRILAGGAQPAAKKTVTHQKTAHKPLMKATKSSNRMDGFARHTPAVKVHKSQEHSKTLMRTAVKKPATPKTHHSIGHTKTAKPHAGKAPIINTHADPMRFVRAEHVKQSKLVSKFGAEAKSSLQAITTVLPVRPAPAESPSIIASVSQAPSLLTHNPLTSALQAATSHEGTKLRKRRLSHRIARKLHTTPKVLNTGALALALVIVGGFFMYQNIPNLGMKMAAARSGVQGNLPEYKPAGFAMLGRINYSAGQITVNYKAHTDDRSYSIVQKKSAWNSEGLLDNFIAASNKQYQTRQDNGKTVYIYDGSNATWVDSGVWYQIEGKSSLSSDQLLRIVDSM